MRSRLIVAVMLIVGSALSGCSGVVSPSNNQLETLTGTLTQNGVNVSGPYNITKSGEYTVTLVSLTPALPVGRYVGVVFSQAVSGGCASTASLASNTFAVAGTQVLGTQIFPGTYCLAIGDVGYLSAGTVYAYTMQFSHP